MRETFRVVQRGVCRGAAARMMAAGLVAAALSGCQTFIPGHANSYDLTGERVIVRPLVWERPVGEPVARYETLSDADKADWEAVFGPKATVDQHAFAKVQDGMRSMAEMSGAGVIGALAGAAVDYAQAQLEAEASRYEAQFSGRAARDDFWEVTWDRDDPSYTQRYYGIEVIRTTAEHDESAPAFRLLLGIAPSRDQAMFLVAPLSFVCRSSKAKVLDTNEWSYLPPLWWHYLLESGEFVDTSVDVEIEAAWMRRDEAVHAQVALVPVQLHHYDLTKTETWRASKGTLDKAPAGWFGGVPVSTRNSKVRFGAAGTFKVFARVTQRDPSNAREYLEKGAEMLKENRTKIIGSLGGTDGGPGFAAFTMEEEVVAPRGFAEVLREAIANDELYSAGVDTQREEDTVRARSYLATYGFLDERTAGMGFMALDRTDATHDMVLDRAARRDASLVEGLTEFQRFHGLDETGELTQETLELMAQPRCGRPDMGAYVVDGRKWKKRDLTYRIDSWTPDLSAEQVQSAIREAADVWQRAANIVLTETTGDADIVVEFASDEHSDGPMAAFDGPGHTLAHAYFPPPNYGAFAGDLHFDEAETWTLDVPVPARQVDLLTIAVHELGHSLGLDHSRVRDAAMYPIYREPRRRLHADDVNGIQQLYGAPR